MKLLIRNPVDKCIPLRKVENDKPLVCGTLFYMPQRKYTVESLNEMRPKDCILTVISIELLYHPSGKEYDKIVCLCGCGKVVSIGMYNYVRGRSFSCGCLKSQKIIKFHQKYFPKNRNIYASYLSMIRRCYNPQYSHYEYYGGRGVVVCDEWLKSYQSFLDWSLQNGWSKGLQLDKDVKGNGLIYSPNTCMWVTRIINCNNTRRNIKHLFEGEMLTAWQISRKAEISIHAIHYWMKKDSLSAQEAVCQIKRKKN